LAVAIVLGTGGAGLPALGAAIAGTAWATAAGVSAATATAAVGGIAGMAVGMAVDWICCHILRVGACCEKA
jgi:hypothetical protein